MYKFTLYAVRDTKSGKLVRDITNPKRKFWERKGACEAAIKNAKRTRPWYDLELVTLNVAEQIVED